MSAGAAVAASNRPLALPSRAGAVRCASPATGPRRPAAALDRALVALEESEGVVLVDVENFFAGFGFAGVERFRE